MTRLSVVERVARLAAVLLSVLAATTSPVHGLGLDPAEYSHSYLVHPFYRIHWECNIATEEISFLLNGTGERWYGVGVVPDTVTGTVRMQDADMAVARIVDSAMVVEDRHGVLLSQGNVDVSICYRKYTFINFAHVSGIIARHLSRLLHSMHPKICTTFRPHLWTRT